MVKVNAPMLSLDASGSIAGALVFSKWKGRSYVRSLVKPANPKSGGQVGLRQVFKYLTQNWAIQSDSDKASWEDLADQLVASPFNAYMRNNMIMARNFRAPSVNFVRDETQTAPLITTFTAVAGERQITVTLDDDLGGDGGNGYAIFRSTSTGFTPAFDNLVAMIINDPPNEVTFVDTPLEPDTYYYDAKPFTRGGVYGALDGEINAVVT